MITNKQHYVEVPVAVTFQVHTDDQPGFFIPFKHATVVQDVTPIYENVWDVHKQPRFGPAILCREAAAAFVLMQTCGLAATVRYMLRRGQAYNREFAALKAVALHPAHQLLSMASCMNLWFLPFWNEDEFQGISERVIRLGFEYYLPLRTGHSLSARELYNEDPEEFIQRARTHFHDNPKGCI